jgi:hypothetical protein
VVDVWLHRVDEEDSGLTFEKWDPSADTDASQAPVAIIVNSSELHAAEVGCTSETMERAVSVFYQC